MPSEKKIRTRFAPSPTGYLHVGGARTALFNWLYARHHGGSFVLRVEDTDQLRSTDESTQAILDAMNWLGLDWDEGPFFQAQRADRHRQMARQLVSQGKAYYCNCSAETLDEMRKTALAEGRNPKYDGRCRDKHLGPGPGTVIRFRCPDSGTTLVDDLVKGPISFNNDELDDLIIERSDAYPTYNFAVVVDDAEMEITHVIRGDDHINNTPRQILLYEALGYPLPRFGHVPMILGSDKARLSKRHGATSVMAYREMGYLPEALVNYLARLSWSHGDQEIFTVDELIALFDLDNVGKSAAVFSLEKLLWLNQHYIRQCPPHRLAGELAPFLDKLGIAVADPGFAAKVAADFRGRCQTLDEMAQAGAFYFADSLCYDAAAAQKFLVADAAPALSAIAEQLPALADYSKEGIETLLRATAEACGVKMKLIAQPLRVALSGKTVSPGLDEMMITLGKDRVVQRIEAALKFIGA